MKGICVLGSTGSIGRQTLDVIRASNGAWRADVLCAGGNSPASRDTLIAQAREFIPALVCVENTVAANALKGLLPKETQLYCGPDAGVVAAGYEDADIAVNGISGFAGTLPLIAALKAGKRVALANKESIACALPLVKRAEEEGAGRIIPVDSEQSAIFQCLAAGRREDVARLILTASGGPFRTFDRMRLASVTPGEAMAHPTWNMGGKVTLDSATLFNKGLELIEAAHLFGFDGDSIDVLIHPQSVVHSMVEYCDGSVMAQLSAPDMRIAIHYALTWPVREESCFGRLDLAAVSKLTFERPDDERFPAIGLARAALRAEGLAPCVYSAANEAAGGLFMQGKIGFLDIPALVEKALANTPRGEADSVNAIIETDGETRRYVMKEAGISL